MIMGCFRVGEDHEEVGEVFPTTEEEGLHHEVLPHHLVALLNPHIAVIDRVQLLGTEETGINNRLRKRND